MSLSAAVDASGISAPDYPTVLAGLTDGYRAIYGADAYLEPDSQDGALLAIFALALSDTNSMAIAVYNAFSPATAQGEGLSSVVRINGISRKVPSFSTADVVIVGQAGTQISNGIVLDPANGQWVINSNVTIPGSGQIVATATYSRPGAVSALAGTLAVIGTPTRGWQTVTNPIAATLGAVVESDAGLRVRQRASTALPSSSILDGMIGAVINLTGVLRLASYENDTSIADANTVPAHTVSFVVDGGDAQLIANTIAAKKAPGVGTYGTTKLTVIDVYSIPQTVNFFRPTFIPIKISVSLTILAGFTTATLNAIQAAVVAYINGLPIAAPVLLSRLYVPLDSAGSTYNVNAVTLARTGGILAAADVRLLFNEAATCLASDVAITATP